MNATDTQIKQDNNVSIVEIVAITGDISHLMLLNILTGNVSASALAIKNDSISSSNEIRNAKRPAANIVGFKSGTVTLRKLCHELAPMMVAATSIEGSTCRRPAMHMITTNGKDNTV